MSQAVKALLVIDMLRDFVEEGAPLEVPRAREIVPAIQAEIQYFRDRKRPIVFVCDQHAEDDPEFRVWPRHAVSGSRGAEVIPALKPQPEDTIVAKTTYSGFFQTALESILNDLRVTDLHITGVCTEICVLYTAADAFMRGFRVIVPETCVAGLSDEDHRFALRQVRDVLKPKQG